MERPDFTKEPYFYRFLGLFLPGQEQPTALENGSFLLRSNIRYEMQFLHWAPRSDPHKLTHDPIYLSARVGDATEIINEPVLVIDSPYDIKILGLRAFSG